MDIHAQSQLRTVDRIIVFGSMWPWISLDWWLVCSSLLAGQLFFVALQPNLVRVADPHNSSLGLASLATAPTSDLSVVSQAAGLYHLLATLGFVQEQQIYTAVVLLECFACLCLAIGCCGSFTGSYSWDTSVLDIAQGSWLRCVSLSTLGLVCLAWAGHLVHVAVPQSRGVISDFTNISGSVASPIGLRALCLADWFVEQAKRYSRGQHS